MRDTPNLQNATTPRQLLALLMAMTAIGPATLNIVVPALPSLATRLATDTGTVQLTLSLYLLSLATAQLVLGPLSDRFGRRPVVLAGLAINLVASAGAIAASSIEMLIVARAVQAVGAASGIVMGRAIIRDLYERDRAAAMMGLVTTAMVIAPMVSPLIGGLLDTAFGWEAIFLAIAVMSCAVLIWAWLALPETRRAETGTPGAQGSQWRDLFRQRQFYGYVLCAAAGTGPFFTFLGAGPHVVVTQMGHTSAEYGMWFAITSFAYMSGNFTVSRLSQRYGANRMIVAGTAFLVFGAVATLICIQLFWHWGPASIFVPQLALSYGSGMVLPNAMAGAVSVRPKAAGAASGMTGFTQMALGAASTQIVSVIIAGAADAMPMAWMLLFWSVTTGLAYLTLVHQRPRRI